MLERGLVEGVFMEPWDAEVAAEVEEIEEAEVAGDDDYFDVLDAGEHDYHSGYVCVFEAYPDVCAGCGSVGWKAVKRSVLAVFCGRVATPASRTYISNGSTADRGSPPLNRLGGMR